MKPAPPFLALAESCGIDTHFKGADGKVRSIDEDVIRAVLGAWGIDCGGPDEAARVLRDRQHEAAQRVMEPVLVHRIGLPSAQSIRLPKRLSPDRLEFILALEDGEIRRLPLSEVTMDSPPGTVIPPGAAVHQVDLERTGLASIPPGYHRAHLEGPGVDADALVVCAPRCPAAQRGWGLFMPTHAMRSGQDWGIGSYRDMASLGQWAKDHGASMLGSLPLYPILTSVPIDPSPYLPASKLAYNELFIDLTIVPELERAPELRAHIASDEFRRRVGRAHMAKAVPYDDVAVLKYECLKMLSASLMATDSERRTAFIHFGQQHPELVAYAEFRSGQQVADRSDFYTFLYGQWVATEQLTSVQEVIDLYADLPIGVHPDGFDPQHYPHSFVTSAHGGAPPDLFFEGGQDWSFPPLHPDRIRDSGYAYLRATLRRACRHAGALRIDHAMGIHRLYWIPDGFDAAHGTYVHSNAEEMRAIIALEAFQSQTVIVGEDLGTVPFEVRRDMAEDHMLRSWVMQFESNPTAPLPDPPAVSLASWGTHDLPRFLAYFDGDDIERQVEDGWISDAERTRLLRARLDWRRTLAERLGIPQDDGPSAYRGCLEWMAASKADFVLIDLEELWGERIAHNVPGTGPERGNWVRRAARPLEDVSADERITVQLSRIDRCRSMSASDNAAPLTAGVGAEASS